MCGIAGIYRFNGQPVETATLERMKRATVHRGPDDEGILADGNIGLVHNRLSILDLSPAGHQPMRDDVSGNWIVYNGEIYNFPSVRRELEDLGYCFRSSGDTEVILYAFRQWGKACLERISGMFALAIWCPTTRTLFLARDRVGIKPLYYYLDKRQLVFASETKSILKVEGTNRGIDHQALPELVAFRYLANGRTLFQGIRELPPGHQLEASPEGVQTHRYWDIPHHSPAEDDEHKWLEGFEERLRDSVRSHLIADVPVGCALSGGVDSSLITALACEASTSTMKTFSIGFDHPAFDERPYARRVAHALGTENETQVLPVQEFYDRLPQLVWHMDEPINHPNSVGIWLLAKLARQRVTVLLTGEGGDELLGGYPRFRFANRLSVLRRALPGARTAARVVRRRLRGRKGRIAEAVAHDDDGNIIWLSAFTPAPYLELLFGPDAARRAEGERRDILAKAPVDHRINRHLYYEMKTYLVSLLMRVDKMCMAASLENRVPLLDHQLVEYVARMPLSLKVNRHQGKVAMFRLVGRRFGDALFNRPKAGFALPHEYFHRGAGLERLKSIIDSRSFRERGLVDPRAVSVLLRGYEQGELPADAVWILASLELWARSFIDKPAEVSAA